VPRCSPLNPDTDPLDPPADSPALIDPPAGPPDPARADGRRAGPGRRALEWIVPEGNPTAVVHGTILTAALLAVESTRSESLPAAAGSVLLATVILWIAHAYSAALGDRLHHPAPWTLRHLLEVALHEARLLQGAALPLVVLLVAAAVGASDRTAVLAALVAAASALLVLELAAAVASHLGRAALVAQVAVSLLIGVGVLALKVIVH
jgi:hypothetical protein